MQNIDKKIMYILRLNKKLNLLDGYLLNNSIGENKNPILIKFMLGNITEATRKRNIIKNVLINLNYLNY